MDGSVIQRKSYAMPNPAQSGLSSEKTPLRPSLSRPDSFLPIVPAANNVEAPQSMPFKYNAAAASSGSDLSKDRLIQLLSSVEDEYDKVTNQSIN